MAGQTVIVSVLADTRRFNTAMAGTDKTLARFSTGLRNISRVGTLVFGTLAFAAGRFTISAVEAADAAAAIDNKLANTAQQMDIFGKKTDDVVKRLQDLAYSQQFVIGQDDDLIKSVQTVLLTFANLAKSADVVGGEFDRVTALAFDLSSTFGTDVSSAAVQLGKALNDPIGGISSLTRIGIQFSDQQKEQIANYVETNRLAEAQAIILKELERQVGGNAEAGATASQKLKTAFGNLQEVFGERILSVFADDLVVLADELKKLSESQAFKDFSEEFGKSIQNLVKSKSLPKLLDQVTKFLEYLNKNDISLLNFAIGAGLANVALGFLAENLGDFFAIFTASNASKVATNAANLTTLRENLRLLDGEADMLTGEIERFYDVVDQPDAVEAAWLTEMQDKLEVNRTKASELTDELALLTGATTKLGDEADKAGKKGGKLTSFLDKTKSFFTVGIPAFFANFGKGIVTVIKGVGRFAGVIGIVIAAFEILQGIWKGFTDAFDQYFKNNPGKVREFKKLWEDLTPVLEFLGGILEGFGYIVGTILAGAVIGVYETFKSLINLIIDGYNAVADQLGWAKLQRIGGNPAAPEGLVNSGYGSINQVERGRASAASAPIVVNVNALTPTPEVGRVVVAAIADYQRTGGVR